MQPRGGGRGGGPPLDPELERRFQQANLGVPWQAAGAFADQYGASYGLPYAVGPAFPSQAQLGYMTPAHPGSGADIQWGQLGVSQMYRNDSRPASAGQGPAAQLPLAALRPAVPQFGYYPQFTAGYPMQYFSQPGQWRPMPAQQAALAPFLPQSQGLRGPFPFPTSQAYIPQQARQQGRQEARPPQRGRSQRQPDPNRGAGRGQYRAMWQEVTQVAQGQNWQNNVQNRSEQLSVEDLIIIVQRLPPGMSPIPAVAQGLHSLDSRACAALLKDLSKNGLPHHALTIFDWLQSLPPENDLSQLCDVFTYTTVISLCGQRQELGKALTLVADMRGRGINPNIHTYTALINTCIRSGDYTLALDVFKTLEEEGCQPNVVTYNTLIDVYGKMGRWEDAVQVLDDMTAKGWQPETRTFNTAIIACNMCNQSAQALQVYDRMQEESLEPTATTYTALVSAYCKSDDLDAALEVYNTMVAKRQERNIITYSSLIAAADRAGRWEEGLSTWSHMAGDRCYPNLPAYNSAISCCAQGGKWQQAREIFDQMKQARFKPDVSTYTALLAAYYPANRWRQALQAHEQMQAASIRPDTALYAAVIDLLWMSGIVGAQQRAQQLFQLACRQSVKGVEATQAMWREDEGALEVSIEAPVASIAALALHKWLQDLHQKVQTDGPACLQKRIVLSVGHFTRSPSQAPALPPARADTGPQIPPEEEEQQTGVSWTDAQAGASSAAAQAPEAQAVADDEAGPSSLALRVGADRSPQSGQKRMASALPAVAARIFGPEHDAAANQAAILDMVRGFGLRFKAMDDSDKFALEADAETVAEWLQAGEFDAIMTGFAQPIITPVAGRSITRSPMQANLSFLQAEEATALNCSKAWASLRKFESYFPDMTFGAELDEQYRTCRPQCLALSKQSAEAVGLNEGIALDAVLMLDRLLHQRQQEISEADIPTLVGSCLVLATRFGLDQPQPVLDHTELADIVNVPAGVLTASVERIQGVFQAAAPASDSNGLATVSAARCLNVYLERLGALQADSSGLQDIIARAFESALFVSVQPSLLAAAAFQAYKESQGVLPAWPSALAELTGWKDDNSPESEFHRVLVSMRAFVTGA